VPMFLDKAPIAWGRDPAALVMRKTLRTALSSAPAQAVIRWVTRWIEDLAPSSRALPHLYNWQVSAHIRRGYREGLRELARDV